MIKRSDGTSVTGSNPGTWYVRGSYLLDGLFGAAKAKDVDVFYTGPLPSRLQIGDWLAQPGMHPPPMQPLEQLLPGGIMKPMPRPNVHFTSVSSLSPPDGGSGGFWFNVDCLHLGYDRTICWFDVTEKRSTPYRGKPDHLTLINPDRCVLPRTAVKGLLKMILYTQLADQALARRLADDAREHLAEVPSGPLPQGEAVVAKLLEMILKPTVADERVARELAETFEQLGIG